MQNYTASRTPMARPQDTAEHASEMVCSMYKRCLFDRLERVSAKHNQYQPQQYTPAKHIPKPVPLTQPSSVSHPPLRNLNLHVPYKITALHPAHLNNQVPSSTALSVANTSPSELIPHPPHPTSPSHSTKESTMPSSSTDSGYISALSSDVLLPTQEDHLALSRTIDEWSDSRNRMRAAIEARQLHGRIGLWLHVERLD